MGTVTTNHDITIYVGSRRRHAGAGSSWPLFANDEPIEQLRGDIKEMQRSPLRVINDKTLDHMAKGKSTISRQEVDGEPIRAQCQFDVVAFASLFAPVDRGKRRAQIAFYRKEKQHVAQDQGVTALNSGENQALPCQTHH
ncbi:hypothetical protein Syun_021592 [Stephania yunnanensis]|uniref:Uncharacterized protein n=1 Tax=Stephania yunnanensis TaxID=152371 RepID=A0AAP0IGN8_9MAGN